MQQADWILSAVASMTTNQDILLFDAGQAPHVRFRVPMLLTGGRIKRLTLPGAVETGEPGDLVWTHPAELERLTAHLAGQSRAVVLPRVPATSPSLAMLREAFRQRGFVRVTPATGAPYIELDPGWVEPESRFNAGRRSDFRRAERHAQKQGGLTFEVHQHVVHDELDRLLDECYAVEARSWKGSQGSALAVHPKLGPFFRDYAHAAMRSRMLRLALMRVGGQAVGMQIAVQWQERFWLLKIGYDPAFARCSPGTLLMLHTIGYAARQGLRSYEFLGSPAPWTTQWTDTLRPYSRVQIYPYSVPGAMAWLEDVYGYVKDRLASKLSAPPAEVAS